MSSPSRSPITLATNSHSALSTPVPTGGSSDIDASATTPDSTTFPLSVTTLGTGATGRFMYSATLATTATTVALNATSVLVSTHFVHHAYRSGRTSLCTAV